MTDREHRSMPPVHDPDPGSGAIVVVVAGPLDRTQIQGLCERVRVILEHSDAEVVICDVSALVDPDVGTVDTLARLALTARRLGRRVRLRQPCGELRDLLVLLGMDDVVPTAGDLSVEPRRQAEQREHPRRVQERVEGDDLAG